MSEDHIAPPSIAEIEAAADLIAHVARRTPVIDSVALTEQTGARVALKAENLQRTGSFKVRGAYVRIAALTPGERSAGVVAASAGNHAQGVARAASALGVPATIFMSVDASLAKIEATRRYGAEVRQVGESLEDALRAAQEHAAASGATFVSPFDDPHVVAGQGTVGLELAAQVDDLATVVVPCGGGGLLSGIAIALRARRPGVRIVGVQAAGCPAVVRSREQGRAVSVPRAQTIADGIAVKRPGDLTLPLIERLVDDVVCVDDAQIVTAMALLLERHKLLVEGAGAAAAAAVMAGVVEPATHGTTAVVLSGGNIDLPLVQAVIRTHLTASRRYLRLRLRLPDRPGSLARLSALIAEEGVNVVDVVHHREGIEMLVTDTEIEITVETRGDEHATQLYAVLDREGFRPSG